MSVSVDVLDGRLSSLSARSDQAIANLRDAIKKEGETERLYSVARSNAWLATTGTTRDREAQVDKTVAAEREQAHVAAGMTKAALEEVRTLREQMSNLRTLAAAQRAQEFNRP